MLMTAKKDSFSLDFKQIWEKLKIVFLLKYYCEGFLIREDFSENLRKALYEDDNFLNFPVFTKMKKFFSSLGVCRLILLLLFKVFNIGYYLM